MALFVAFYAGSILVFSDSLHNWQGAGQAERYERADAQPFMGNFLNSVPGARESFYLMLPGSGQGLSAAGETTITRAGSGAPPGRVR